MLLRAGWTGMVLLVGLSGVAMAGEEAMYCAPGQAIVNVDRASSGNNPGVTMVLGAERPITLQIVNTVTTISPHADYQTRGRGRLDDNHFVLQAQRLHHSLTAEPVVVIRGSGMMDAGSLSMIKPLLIIPIRRQDGNPLDGVIPMVPEPARSGSRQMVMAE